jgi:microcystin-dependent protein
MFAGNFAPAGWSFCDGSLVPIDQNPTLFQLIGTTYGGDGQNNFALPNLQSRVPIHVGPGFALGQAAGVETVTLTTAQIPAHSHVPQCFSNPNGGGQNSPQNGVWATSTAGSVYSTTPLGGGNATMNPAAIGSTGGSQPHDNMIPFLVINFIISLFGVFPSQS